MSEDMRERLAEIRANDKLVHRLHGSGWDDHATDAEIDRADLLAIVDAQRAALDALSARHQPKTAFNIKPCRDHLGFIGPHPTCRRCIHTTIQVCSNLTCCTWPCEDRKAIDAALDAPEDGQQ
jgi:hypothetical protein